MKILGKILLCTSFLMLGMISACGKKEKLSIVEMKAVVNKDIPTFEAFKKTPKGNGYLKYFYFNLGTVDGVAVSASEHYKYDGNASYEVSYSITKQTEKGMDEVIESGIEKCVNKSNTTDASITISENNSTSVSTGHTEQLETSIDVTLGMETTVGTEVGVGSAKIQASKTLKAEVSAGIKATEVFSVTVDKTKTIGNDYTRGEAYTVEESNNSTVKNAYSTYESSSYAETKTITYKLEKGMKEGYYRFATLATCDVYAILVIDTENYEYTVDYQMFPIKDKFYNGIQYSSDNNFDRPLDVKFELDLEEIKNYLAYDYGNDKIIEDGSSMAPYTIDTIDEFNEIFSMPTSSKVYFILTKDIVANSETEELIKKRNNIFYGYFDGNNYSIDISTLNLSSVIETNGYYGLFSEVKEGAVIKNLNVKGNVEISKIDKAINNSFTFGMLAGNNLGKIENCYASGSIDNYVDSLNDSLGSVVGGISGVNRGEIISCGSKVRSITSGDTGGIVGHNYSTIDQCYNAGDITYKFIKCKGRSIGGICGANFTAIVTNSYNVGQLDNINSGEIYFPKIGGIIGYLANDTILKENIPASKVENCYNAGLISVTDSVKNSTAHIVGVAEGTFNIKTVMFVKKQSNVYVNINSSNLDGYDTNSSGERTEIKAALLNGNSEKLLWDNGENNLPILINNPFKF